MSPVLRPAARAMRPVLRPAARAWRRLGRARAAGLLLLSALLLPSAAPAPVRAAGNAAAGDPAARLLATEHASDVWDLTVALDDGTWVVAQVTISNVGPGDRTGAAVGHVLTPDGAAHEFHKVRSAGGWQLSPDQRRIDLDSIIFDQSRSPARFYVSKRRVDVDLHIDLSGEAARAPVPGEDRYGMDLLALGAPVQGRVRLADAPSRPVQGLAILTHRWMDALESRWVDRRVSLFGLADDAGLYLTEVTAPDGKARRWLVVGREGRIVERSDEVVLAPAESGGVALSSASASGRLGIEAELLRDDPLSRAPWVARWWVGRLTRPRFVWRRAPFDLTVSGPRSAALRLAGRGLLQVARFDAGEEAPAAPPLWGIR